MTEVNLLTCPWGLQNPERKEKDTRVRKLADLENTQCPENSVLWRRSQGAPLLGVDGESHPPTAGFQSCHVTGRQSTFTCEVNSFRHKSSARVHLLRSELGAPQLSPLPEEPQGVSFTHPSLHARTKHVCPRTISGIIYSLCNIQSVHNSFRAT